MKITCYNHFMKSEQETTEFGKNLRKIRKEKGYTQVRLAKLSGVSRRVIGHYETEAKRPTIDKVKKLAAAIEVSDEELLGIAKPKDKKKKDEGLSYKLMKKLRLVEELPTRDQNTVFSLINALSEKNRLKKDSNQ